MTEGSLEADREQVLLTKTKILTWLYEKHQVLMNHLSYMEKLGTVMDYDPMIENDGVQTELKLPDICAKYQAKVYDEEEKKKYKKLIKYPPNFERIPQPEPQITSDGIYEFFLQLKYFPLYKYLQTSHKIITSKDWQIAAKELRAFKVLESIEELKSMNMWSSRQMKKQIMPQRHKAKWDYLLEEMEWMSVDFQQERKWKKCLAKKCALMIEEYFSNKNKAASNEANKEMKEPKLFYEQPLDVDELLDNEDISIYGPPDYENDKFEDENENLPIVPLYKWQLQDMFVGHPAVNDDTEDHVEISEKAEKENIDNLFYSPEEIEAQEGEQSTPIESTAEWTVEEDDLLITYAEELSFNWTLLAELINSSAKFTVKKSEIDIQYRYAALESVDSSTQNTQHSTSITPIESSSKYDLKIRKNLQMRGKLLQQEAKKRETSIISFFESVKKLSSKHRPAKTTTKKTTLSAHPSHDGTLKKLGIPTTRISTPSELAMKRLQRARTIQEHGMMMRPPGAPHGPGGPLPPRSTGPNNNGGPMPRPVPQGGPPSTAPTTANNGIPNRPNMRPSPMGQSPGQPTQPMIQPPAQGLQQPLMQMSGNPAQNAKMQQLNFMAQIRNQLARTAFMMGPTGQLLPTAYAGLMQMNQGVMPQPATSTTPLMTPPQHINQAPVKRSGTPQSNQNKKKK
ncbi:hypothetical protein O9G_000093 [Rozella allomycis CSF55]|uniref:Vacuolar import and degradation protein 21 n=1 Tax=Rozella allomycis (strain CSF55) TaxID=988480 RepID=A0A075ANY5_ROZAC|nr:hypothetical protein O9G_000093 [Rozella allomycis CSF55]|eukprot:EPZ31614.1 hypothetical protein O9G_000093 [Rozella allomycis CSF55]